MPKALLWQANRVEEEGRSADAARYLVRYLEFVPKDVDSLARLGELREKLAITPRQHAGAFMIFEKVLRADPSRTEVRRKSVRLAMDLGRTPMRLAICKCCARRRRTRGTGPIAWPVPGSQRAVRRGGASLRGRAA